MLAKNSSAGTIPANPAKVSLMDHVLQTPSYGWADRQGDLVVPTTRQVFSEFWSRLNVFQCKKNWLVFFGWLRTLLLSACFVIFLVYYFTPLLLAAAFVYSMIVMGTHGTIWHHRYCTHQAYTFRNNFWRFITRNLTISVIPEEIYVISHHVHHAKSDQPGDPYNANAGFLYCFLADANHQPISQDLSQADYTRVVQLMRHTGVRANSYRQYQKWASIAQPMRTITAWLLNWAFWAGAFWLIGGMGLVFAMFGAAGFWAIGVRTFNYEGHGKGKDKQREGIDFNKKDRSINQLWPGYVAGEWHNNHHLFPSSARSGFLRHQLDLAWCYIRFLKGVGAVASCHDAKKTFLAQYRQPYQQQKKEARS